MREGDTSFLSPLLVEIILSLCLGIFLTTLIHILHVQVFVLQIFFTGRNMSYGRHITDQYSYTTSWFQCWSILVLKAFTSFAATTRSGNEFQSFITLCEKCCCLVVVLQRGFSNLRL